MTRLEIIDTEIAPKGVCYVICRTYDAADFDDCMRGACETARACGARTIGFAMRDETHPLDGDVIRMGGHVFRFDTAFDILEKTLAEETERGAAGPLHEKRLREAYAPMYAALYNESFFDVPNGRTMDEKEVEAILSDEGRDAGFLMLGGEPVGIFALDYRRAPVELAALAIRPAWRGRGFGEAGLRLIETRLMREGRRAVQLLAARRNERAYWLYQTCGYEKQRELSRWFVAEL